MKKKLIMILSSVIVLGLFSSNIYAKDTGEKNGETSSETEYIPLRDEDIAAIAVYEDIDSISKLNEKPQISKNPFKNNNQMGQKGYVVDQAWATANITRFYQDDYSDKLCPNTNYSLTIASHGCVVTSFAMVATKYGISTNPVHVKNRVNQDAPGTYSGCNFLFADIVTVSPFNVLSYQNLTTSVWSKGLSRIRGALKSDRAVLLFMQKGINTHAVVVYGYEKYSDGQYYHYIFNPSKNSPRQTSVEEYITDGWNINKVFVYYK